MARPNTLVKIALALAVLAGVGVLFVRSVIHTQSAPYTVRGDRLSGWTLVFDSASSPTGAALMLRSSPDLLRDLFRDVFRRSGQTLSGPPVAEVPLLLKSEFDRAFAGGTTSDALLAAARDAGLDTITLNPRCLATRRVSAPGVTEELYFVIFDLPAFGPFREQIGGLADTGAPGASYTPAALTPVLIVAATSSAFGRWLPLHANPAIDCVAPIVVSGS